MEIDKLPYRKESVLPDGVNIATTYVAGHHESRELVNIVQAAPWICIACILPLFTSQKSHYFLCIARCMYVYYVDILYKRFIISLVIQLCNGSTSSLKMSGLISPSDICLSPCTEIYFSCADPW
jgi:hypothetical protein